MFFRLFAEDVRSLLNAVPAALAGVVRLTANLESSIGSEGIGAISALQYYFNDHYDSAPR